METISIMRQATPTFANLSLAGLLMLCVSAAIVALWAWLGAPVRLPGSEANLGEPLYCVSYAPFRSHQSPFDASTRIGHEQVEEDLQRIKKISNCVRTYATDFGSQHVPAIARRLDMKVLMGIWIGDDVMRNRVQVETGAFAGEAASPMSFRPSSSATRCCCGVTRTAPNWPPSSRR